MSENNKKAKVLVTGGTGYIGSHTVVELQNNGFDVVIIDNLSNSDISVLNNIKKITGQCPRFEELDILDSKKLKKFFDKNEDIEAVIHFAAYKSVGESIEQPLKYYKNNISGIINILEEIKIHKIPNFIFSSSATVYGEADKFPVTEDSPIKKASCPYGNTKIISEQILKDLSVSDKNFKTICLRYFNPIGAHDSSLIGELPIGIPANLVPIMTQCAIGLRKEIKIFGNDYNTPDGSCIRDYIHVVDLAKAHIKALNRLIQNKNKNNFEAFNIGTGQGTSVLEMIKIFEKVSGIKLNYSISNRRDGDVPISYADVNLANKELDWKTERTIEESLLSAWNWEKNIKNKKTIE